MRDTAKAVTVLADTTHGLDEALVGLPENVISGKPTNSKKEDEFSVHLKVEVN